VDSKAIESGRGCVSYPKREGRNCAVAETSRGETSKERSRKVKMSEKSDLLIRREEAIEKRAR
jgi:hypothetical protein